MYNRSMCSLTVADDMVLVSLSKARMDCMLNICWEYTRKWHYFYNSSKSEVVVFNERMPIQPLPRISVGQDPIKESEHYRHLGVKYVSHSSAWESILQASNKLHSTYFSICGAIQPSSAGPITLSTVYKAI